MEAAAPANGPASAPDDAAASISPPDSEGPPAGLLADAALAAPASPPPPARTPVAAAVSPGSAASVGPLKPIVQTLNNCGPAAVAEVLNHWVNEPAMVEVARAPAAGDPAIRSLAPVAAACSLQLQWDGKDDHGRTAPAGSYRVQVTATGASGHRTPVDSDPVTLTKKYVLVSERQQMLYP
jgi:hypothetical protein